MNEVEIVVTSTDRTDFNAIHNKTKSAGDKIRDALTKAGGDGATGFGVSFSQRIGPLLARAPISPYLLAGVAASAPAIASTLVTSITTGAGIGAVALGAAISTKNPVVAAGLTDLKTFIGSELQTSSQPFVPAMLRNIERAKTGFRSIRPELDAVFAKASTYLDPLVDGAAEFVANALPGFGKLVDSAKPLVDILGEELPQLGEDFAGLLESIGSAASENEDEFRAILDTLGLIVDQTSFWVDNMEYLGSAAVPAVLDGLRKAREELSQINDVGGSILGDAPDSLKEFLYGAEELAEPFDLAADAVRSFREEMQKLIDNTLGVEQASLNWQEAIDGVTESIADNGKSLDANTAKGRANRQSLLDLAQAGLEYADAIYEDKAALGDVAGAEAAAEAAYQKSRSALVAAARQFGLSAAEAEAYVTEILGIPPTRNTRADFTGDNKGVSDWKRTLSGIPREIFTSARLRAIIDIEVRREQATEATGRAHGGIVGAASGGLRSNMTLVGEHGPELLSLPPGTPVHSNPDTERMLSSGGGGTQVIEVRPAPGWDSRIMNEIVQGLIFTMRTDPVASAEIRGN